MSEVQAGQRAGPRKRRELKVLTIEAGFILLLVSIRALGVAHYQPQIALTILDKTGFGSVALGSLIPLIPLLLPFLIEVLSVLAIVAAFVDWWYELPVKQLGLAYLLIFPTLLVTPITSRQSFTGIILASFWRHWIVLILVGIVIAVVLRLDQQLRSDKGKLAWAVVAAVPLLFATGYPRSHVSFYTELTRMWLSPERVVLKTHEQFVGYALEDTPRESVFLIDEGRLIRHIQPNAILSRDTCRLGPPSSLPAWRDASPGFSRG